MDRKIKNLETMSNAEVKRIKMIVFDVDGVIIPKGSNLHESSDGNIGFVNENA